MYEFITGPLLWFTFIIFIAGSLFRFLTAAHRAKEDRIVFPRMGLGKSISSLSRWVNPYTRLNFRVRPVLTVITIVFHVCLVATPLLLLSHNLLWEQAWNIRWWSLPETAADTMTVTVILACLFFLFRRIILSEVQYVTSWRDYVLLGITAAPFITGFLTYHQWFAYKFMLIAHILSANLMLLAIPFTRLGHMISFYLTRGYMGSEYGKEGNPRG